MRGMRYRAWYTQTLLTSNTALSSSSSGVYASPSTRTLSPGFTVPDRMRPKASSGARASVNIAREREEHMPVVHDIGKSRKSTALDATACVACSLEMMSPCHARPRGRQGPQGRGLTKG